MVKGCDTKTTTTTHEKAYTKTQLDYADSSLRLLFHPPFYHPNGISQILSSPTSAAATRKSSNPFFFPIQIFPDYSIWNISVLNDGKLWFTGHGGGSGCGDDVLVDVFHVLHQSLVAEKEFVA